MIYIGDTRGQILKENHPTIAHLPGLFKFSDNDSFCNLQLIEKEHPTLSLL